MKRFRLFLSLLVVLLFASSAFASPFVVMPKRGSAWSVSYSAEALAYQTRVEADGGIVIDLDAVEAAYQLIANQSLTVFSWHSPRFGVKFDTTAQVVPTLTSETITCNLSLESGKAFITNPSVDLTPYRGMRIVLTDSAGKELSGFIKAAGTGETYGDELITNGVLS